MPPKKKGAPQRSTKAEKKEQERIIQDKTFGLKNKNKSKKVQQYCQSVQNRVQNKTKQVSFRFIFLSLFFLINMFY